MHMSAHMSVHMSMHMSVHMSVHMSMHMYMHTSDDESISGTAISQLSMRRSSLGARFGPLRTNVYGGISIYMPLRMFIHLSIYLPTLPYTWSYACL